MKQIAELIRNNEVDLLRRLIKISVEAKKENVFFLGKTYSIDNANQILLYMYNEQAKQNQIRRAERSTEYFGDTDSKS